MQRYATPKLSSPKKQFNFEDFNTTISHDKNYFLQKELNSASGEKKI